MFQLASKERHEQMPEERHVDLEGGKNHTFQSNKPGAAMVKVNENNQRYTYYVKYWWYCFVIDIFKFQYSHILIFFF